jgi:hypothetical protein
MPDPVNEKPFQFTHHQINEFARNNVRSLALGAINFCIENKLSPEAYWRMISPGRARGIG